MSERLVFQQAVEALLKRIPRELQEGPLRAELRDAGLDLDKPLMPAYPLDQWVKISSAMARAMFPNAEVKDAHRQLGRRLVDGYFETFIGKALLASLKVIGPRRALLRTGKNFRTANNYTEFKHVEHAPTDFDVWLNEVQTEPEYTAGIIEAGMTAAGAQACTVTVVGPSDSGYQYRVTWATK